MTRWRHALAPVLVFAAALALAAAARYGLVEPADTTAHCDGGAVDAWCRVRSVVIQAFVNQRLGGMAWALAILGLLVGLTRSAVGGALTLAALFVASAGLVLYTTEMCAPAALLAVLAWAREGQATAARTSISAP